MKSFVYLSILVLLAACGDSAPKATNNNAAIPVTGSDSLYKAVMEVHDVAMARMGEMIRYKKLLRQQADSIKGLKDHDTALVEGLENAAKDLNDAEELMNKWMQEFDPDAAGTTEKDMTAYYSREKEKVDTVKVRIFSSLEKAQQLVK